MSDAHQERAGFLRELTHENVEKLLAVVRGERAAREALQKRFDALEKHVRGQTVDINEAKAKANGALAIARNANGSSTSVR